MSFIKVQFCTHRLYAAMWTLQLAVMLRSHSMVEVVLSHKVTEVTPEWLFGSDPVDYSLVIISTEVTESICRNIYIRNTFDLQLDK